MASAGAQCNHVNHVSTQLPYAVSVAVISFIDVYKRQEIISERTVGKYMKQMGIKAQWIKPWTITTKDSDFSSELKNILDEQFNPERPNAVWCSDITYIWTCLLYTS